MRDFSMDRSTGGEIVSKVSFHESLGGQDGANIDLSEPPVDLAVFEQMPVLAPLQKGGFDSGETILHFGKTCTPLAFGEE
jgi:hypothetical protein